MSIDILEIMDYTLLKKMCEARIKGKTLINIYEYYIFVEITTDEHNYKNVFTYTFSIETLINKNEINILTFIENALYHDIITKQFKD